MEPYVLMVAIVGIAIYFTLKQRFQREVHLAAIEKGMGVPKFPQPDLRKPALVLIALGLGFSIAAFVAFSFATGHRAPHPLQVSIWGIIPVFIGAALLIFKQMAAKDQEDSSES